MVWSLGTDQMAWKDKLVTARQCHWEGSLKRSHVAKDKNCAGFGKGYRVLGLAQQPPSANVF